MKLGMIIFTMMSLASMSYGRSDEKVIYGDDNRMEPSESSVFYQQLAISTAAQIPKKNVSISDETATILGQMLINRNICEDQRFIHQSTAANCSGFLVAEDVLITAGHCIRTQSDCDRYYWVFDYIDDGTEAGSLDIPASSVVECKEILDRQLNATTDNDYAVIRLKTKVIDRAPLSVRKEGKIEDNQHLVVIGHPTGLPVKIADDAYVRKNTNPVFFVTNLDTFGGNSGSAVFDAETGIVEGILVRGEDDYVWKDGCKVPKHCEMDECRGEDVTRITSIEKLKDFIK